MKRHLTETEIDFLASGSEELSQRERKEWTAHLERCIVCREHYDIAERFYNDLQAALAGGEKREDAAIADRIAGTTLAHQLSFGRLKPPDALLGTAVERSASIRGGLRGLLYLTVRYPGRTTAAGLLAAALVFALSLRLTPSTASIHSARVHDGILTAYDTEGRELWKKTARGMAEGNTEVGFSTSEGSLGDHFPVNVLDVHPSPGNELIVFSPILYGRPEDSFEPGVLTCFDSQGDVLWSSRYEPDEFNGFTNEKSGSWRIARTFTIPGRANAPQRLFVCIFYTPFSPSALLEIDGATGMPIRQYAHFGFLSAKPYRTHDGVIRLLAHGTNNAYGKPFLALLDPGKISGFGPSPHDPEFYGYRGPRSNAEIVYVLFPRSEFAQRSSRDLQNHVQHVFLNPDGSLVADVNEFPTDPNADPDLAGSILYSFDSQLRVKSVMFSDVIQQTYKRLRADGIRLRPLDSLYANELRNSVEYWNGKGVVPLRGLKFEGTFSFPLLRR
ncbi:MAG: hypothetical protein HBSIN02_22990 [Bacteroidia bacterium]|nr:MAG: hypothetical protein HBSIN02_22990 [Bacteroidia bacterium]